MPERSPTGALFRGCKSASFYLWMIILILPACTTLSAWHEWDINRNYLFFASCWVIISIRLLIPGKLFFYTTFPIALSGLVCVAADILRSIDLLELTGQWRTFTQSEIQATFRPYLIHIAIGSSALLLICMACASWDESTKKIKKPPWLTVIGGTVILVFAFPLSVWTRAWPINSSLLAASIVFDQPSLASYSLPTAILVNPRSASSWNVIRRSKFDGTYVLVIGESIRSDYLAECGKRAIRRFAPGSLIACDVTAGSDATHTSVPLLISREMPGHPLRVSSDSTFQHAFAEAGFNTSWYSTQEISIAWPDAAYQKFLSGPDDRLIDVASKATGSIVIHAYNAHSPYCSRFDRKHAPYGDACTKLIYPPPPKILPLWRDMYANAVDHSVGFVNALIAQFSLHSEPVFLVFTPDHGENLSDDRRELWEHALRHPTRWDIQVPALFWANAAWRAQHETEWSTLSKNVKAPLMHADLVPTLLGAAGLSYQEARTMPVNLLSSPVPERQRVVQTGLGATMNWASLFQEAED